jgi:hypothetical protein
MSITAKITNISVIKIPTVPNILYAILGVGESGGQWGAEDQRNHVQQRNKFKCYLKPAPKFQELRDNKMWEKMLFLQALEDFWRNLIFQSNSTIMCTEIFSEGGRPVYKLDVALQDSSTKQGKMNCKRTKGSKLRVHVSSIRDTSVTATLPRHN